MTRTPNPRARLARLAIFGAMAVVVAWLPSAAAVASEGDAPSVCGKWALVKSPNVGTAGSSLSGVSADSLTDGWGVGNTFTGSTYRTLAERWNGSMWAVVATPNASAGTNALNAVVAITPTDAWAVGFYADGSTFRTLAEHWNGSTWAIVASPNSGTGENVLESVTAIASNDVWAVGFQEATPGAPRVTLAEHWNGSTWTVVATPNSGTDENFLWTVRGRATDDVWAFGSYSVPWFQTLTEHWNGTSWSIVSSPNLGDGSNVLYAGVVLPGARAMAVGTWLDGDQTATLAERWNGTSWLVEPSPSPSADQNFLLGAAASVFNDIWAVGFQRNVPFSSTTTLGEHWDGHTWTVARTKNVGTGSNMLAGIAQIGTTTQYLAVGHYEDGGVDKTLTELRC